MKRRTKEWLKRQREANFVLGLEDEITIRFKYTLDEVLAGLRLHSRRELQRRKKLVYALLVLFVLLSGVGLYFLVFWEREIISLPVLASSLLLIPIYLVARRLLERSKSRREAAFHAAYTLDISEYSVWVQNDYLSHNLEWDKCEGLIEDANLYVLCFSEKLPFLIIPKRAFNIARDAAVFKLLLSKNARVRNQGSAV